jgi:site-specific recombinase XerD
MGKTTGGGWNKGLAIGQKRPFTLDQVQLIRMSLKAGEDKRALALFETALSTMLRAVDLLALKVGDVRDNGGIADEFTLRQDKTDDVVTFFLSEAAQEALAAYLADLDDVSLERPLWLGRGNRGISRLRYSQLVKEWAKLAKADPRFYGTHSMRRTQAVFIYKNTANQEAVRQLLGHRKLAHTTRYLGVSRDKVGKIKRLNEM